MKFEAFEGELEEVHCPVCVPQADTRLEFKGADGIGYYQCHGCNIQYASPRFTEKSLLDIYESEAWIDLDKYRGWTYENWLKKKDPEYYLVKQNINLLKEHLAKGSSILDIGCSIGLTVRYAKDSGFNAEGLEPSSLGAQVAREKVGAFVHHGQIESLDVDYLYDGIMILDVLEHVYDPVRVMKHCSGLVKKGGYIFIHVPHHRGVGNRYKAALCRMGLKKKMKHFGFPWHIYSYDRKSLTALLTGIGFRPVVFESWSHYLTEGKINIFTALPIFLAKKLALSDYIVCVARKEQN